MYFQIILRLQNTAVSAISGTTQVSNKLLPTDRNAEDKQELRGTQQSSLICNTETLHEVRFKIVVYLHTVLKKGMNPRLPSFRSACTKIKSLLITLFSVSLFKYIVDGYLTDGPPS